MTVDDLREVPLLELAQQAQKLARMGRITGEAALAFVVWPSPPDMLRYLKDRKADEEPLQRAA